MDEQLVFRCFKCDSRTNAPDLSLGTYISSKEPCLNVSTNSFLNYSFFGRNYDVSVWQSDINNLLLHARKGILQIEQAAFKTDLSYQSNDFAEIRKYICELWLASRDIILRYKNEEQYKTILDNLASALKHVVFNMTRIHQLPDYVIFNSSKKNDYMVLHPSYYYLHLYLDLHWILLTTECQKEHDPVLYLENFEKTLHSLLIDLIYIGVRKFEKGCNDLETCTPFICSCFKELWLLLQLLVEELHAQRFCKDFWNYFNLSIKESINLENNSDGRKSVCCLWFLYQVACIQGFDKTGNYEGPKHYRVVSNYPLIEECVKSILASTADEKQMRIGLQLLASLQVTWWTRDATFDLLQLQWEHFYKRINTSFALITDSGAFVNKTKKLHDFVALTDAVLHYDTSSSNSYEIFLYLLSYYLKANPAFWSKLKGRIYSKLSVSKLATFSDAGLENLVLLFLVLANSVNFTELAEKLHSLLNQMPAARCDDSAVLWSAHLSLIILYVKRGLSIKIISAPFLELVLQASANRSRVQLMRLFIDGVTIIVEELSVFFCDEHVIFGNSWITRYLQWCPHSEACNLLDLLVTLIDKIKLLGGSQEWWNIFDANVVPAILQLSGGIDAPSQTAEVAAALVSADSHRYASLLEQFTGDSATTHLVEKFLRKLLEKADVQQIYSYQTLIIQAWFRITMLTINQYELIDITQLISRLPLWTESLGSFDVMSEEDPLYTVIKVAGTRVREAQTITETAARKRWFETYFGKMDRWFSTVLASADRGENSKLLLRIYTCGALLFIHCSPALYTKNKTTCLLVRLVSTMLLPTTVLTNKKPAECMLAALRLTWHLFLRGIVRLDYQSDNYIERILKDLVVRYIPHLNDSASPIIRCLDPEFEEDVTVFVMDKVTSLITCRSRNVHEFAPQALNLVIETLKARANVNCNKTEILVRIVTPALLEQFMFVENKSNRLVVIQILELIKKCQFYINLRGTIKNSIITIVDKHLAFYSSSVFQMLEILCRNLKDELIDLQERLKDAVQKVERMRGVGYDNILRKGLQRIQELMNA